MTLPDQLTEREINELVERLNQRPEIRVAQLEDRVRELEAENKRLRMDQLHFVTPLEARISKAREILTASIPQSRLALEITRAVEALEGK